MTQTDPVITDFQPFQATRDRRAYLNHCTKISLKKRWAWILALTLVALTGTYLLNAHPWEIVMTTLIAAFTVTLSIALDSRRRHQYD